jgi:hypothetical protein
MSEDLVHLLIDLPGKRNQANKQNGNGSNHSNFLS